jgi:hypothetical protein
VRDDQGALAVGEHLLESHDFALLFEVECRDDVERLVEHDLLATLEVLHFDGRADVHPQFAAAGEDIDRSIVSGLEEDAES